MLSLTTSIFCVAGDSDKDQLEISDPTLFFFFFHSVLVLIFPFLFQLDCYTFLEILIIFAFMVVNKVPTILDEVRCIH